jgi:hypothetical protein
VVMQTMRSKLRRDCGRAGCQEKPNLPAKGKVFLLDVPFYRTPRRMEPSSPHVAFFAMCGRFITSSLSARSIKIAACRVGADTPARGSWRCGAGARPRMLGYNLGRFPFDTLRAKLFARWAHVAEMPSPAPSSAARQQTRLLSRPDHFQHGWIGVIVPGVTTFRSDVCCKTYWLLTSL